MPVFLKQIMHPDKSYTTCANLPMKRQAIQFFLLSVLLLGATAWPVKAQYTSLGIGGMIGSPTGITLKKWISGRNACDLGAAWSITRHPGLHVHGDFLMHRADLDGMEAGRSYAYYGIGGRLKAVADDPRVGARFPIGITYIDPREPFDAFFEIVPVLDILPETRFALNLSLGGRIYLRGGGERY